MHISSYGVITASTVLNRSTWHAWLPAAHRGKGDGTVNIVDVKHRIPALGTAMYSNQARSLGWCQVVEGTRCAPEASGSSFKASTIIFTKCDVDTANRVVRQAHWYACGEVGDTLDTQSGTCRRCREQQTPKWACWQC